MLVQQQVGATLGLPKRGLTVAHANKSEAKKGAAVALAAALIMGTAAPALADYQSGEEFFSKVGIVKCSESKMFKKMQSKQLKGVQKRLKQYEVGSPVYDFLKAKEASINQSFESITSSGRFCDVNGVPGLVADPGLAFKTGRAGDTVIPFFGLIYFNGWLLHQGKKYLQWIHKTSKDAAEARSRELATGWDWGMALYFLATGFAWPVDAYNEWKTGRIVADPKYITETPY